MVSVRKESAVEEAKKEALKAVEDLVATLVATLVAEAVVEGVEAVVVDLESAVELLSKTLRLAWSAALLCYKQSNNKFALFLEERAGRVTRRSRCGSKNKHLSRASAGLRGTSGPVI